jgi:hypothetical protein
MIEQDPRAIQMSNSFCQMVEQPSRLPFPVLGLMRDPKARMGSQARRGLERATWSRRVRQKPARSPGHMNDQH